MIETKDTVAALDDPVAEINSRYKREEFRCYNVDDKPIKLTFGDKFDESAEMPKLSYDEKDFDIEIDQVKLSGVERPAETGGDKIGHDLFTADRLREVWGDIAKVMPQYKDVVETLDRPKKYVSLIGQYDNELLCLAGVEPSVDSKEMPSDVWLKLMEFILTDMPENMELNLSRDSLCVNGLPTKITASSMELSLNGLIELVGQEKAVETVGTAVRDKLNLLF